MTTSYTDLSLAVLIAKAQGVSTDARSTGVAQGAADRLARAFVTAVIGPPGPFADALGPDVLLAIGRALILEGETCFLIEAEAGVVTLAAGCRFGTSEARRAPGFTRSICLAPSRGVERVTVPADAVFHPRTGWEPGSPLGEAVVRAPAGRQHRPSVRRS